MFDGIYSETTPFHPLIALPMHGEIQQLKRHRAFGLWYLLGCSKRRRVGLCCFVEPVWAECGNADVNLLVFAARGPGTGDGSKR